jgi:transcriptional regulator with XRE-family HTH domain
MKSKLKTRLAIARTAQGLTQREIALKAHIPLSQIRHLESGQRPLSTLFAAKLSSVLGVSAPWLKGHVSNSANPEKPIIIEGMLRSDRAKQWKECLAEMIADCFGQDMNSPLYPEHAGLEILEAVERHLPVRASRRYRSPDDVPVDTKAPVRRRSP